MYYVYTILYCIVYIGIVTHVKYISWTAQTDHAVTFPTSLISRYVLCCVLFIFFFFVYNLCMLYISIFCIFCRFFCLLTIKIFFPQKKQKIVLVISNLCNIQFICKYICGHGLDGSTRYIMYNMSIIVSNCQHCDEQQFQTLSCVHYTIFSVVKLDLFIRALLLDRILALEKTTRTPCVHLVIFHCYGFARFEQRHEMIHTSDSRPPYRGG